MRAFRTVSCVITCLSPHHHPTPHSLLPSRTASLLSRRKIVQGGVETTKQNLEGINRWRRRQRSGLSVPRQAYLSRGGKILSYNFQSQGVRHSVKGVYVNRCSGSVLLGQTQGDETISDLSDKCDEAGSSTPGRLSLSALAKGEGSSNPDAAERPVTQWRYSPL